MTAKKITLNISDEEIAHWIESMPNEKIDVILKHAFVNYKFHYEMFCIENADLGRGGSDIHNEWSINAAIKGSQGENYVFRALEAHFNIVNTSKIARCGDFHIMCNGHNYVLEVKTYTKNIPQTEIVKFHRDIIANRARGGIFVSLTSKIIGMDQPFIFTRELVGNELLPVVYVVSSQSEIIINAVNMVHQMSLAYTELNKCITDQDTIRSRLYSIKEHIEASSRNRSLYLDDVSGVQKTLIKHYDNSLQNEIAINNDIIAIFNCIESHEGIPLDDLIERMDENLKKYADDYKGLFLKIINEIQIKYPEGSWKILKTKLIHNLGCEFYFERNTIAISIPSVNIDEALVLSLWKSEQAELIKKRICIQISESIINSITEIIKGCY